MRSLVLAALLLAVGPAHADSARYRFHLVHDRLMAHLSQGAQRNERAVVAFPKASGFVVASDKANPRRILILTNNHVAGDGPPAGDILFRDGTVARPIRTVATNPHLDYAVVEAELSTGPRAHGVEALELDHDTAPLSPGRHLYTFGAHTGLGIKEIGNTDVRRTIAGGQAVEDYVDHTVAEGMRNHTGPTGFRTVAVGRVLQGSVRPIDIKVGNTMVLGVLSDMPNSPGMSGGPVMDRATHRVLGLHFGGAGPQAPVLEQSTVPMDLILADLKQGLASGSITHGKDLVAQMVGR